MLWCCVTPERQFKTKMIMTALSRGWPDARIIEGSPPTGMDPFAVWGQRWLALRTIPAAHTCHRPYWHIDNGFWRPAKGSPEGYYRITYRGPSPVLLRGHVPTGRGTAVQFKPWRKNGRHVLFAHPGRDFGRAAGFDMAAWIVETSKWLSANVDRPVVERSKDCQRSLEEDFDNCWALVTHSSNVAVDAVLAGIPVFVPPSSPAAPVGNPNFLTLNDPVMPERQAWWNSLMCQQFTLDEMRRGIAYDLLMRVREQVDG